MDVKYLFYGTSSIVVTIISIAVLGSVYNSLNELTDQLTGSEVQTATAEIQPLLNTFCNNDYECKQYEKDCSQCINLLVGGFSLVNRCEEKISCSCIENKCVTDMTGTQ